MSAILRECLVLDKDCEFALKWTNLIFKHHQLLQTGHGIVIFNVKSLHQLY